MRCLNCNNEVPEEVYLQGMVDNGKEFLPFCSSECDHAHHRKMEDGYKTLFKNPDANDVLRKELQSLQEECNTLRKEVEEADRRAGKAERKNSQLIKEAQARRDWLRRAKSDAGYDDSVSFDVVWKELHQRLEKYQELEKAALFVTTRYSGDGIFKLQEILSQLGEDDES